MAKNNISLTGLGIKKLEVGITEVEYNGSVIEVVDYIPINIKFAIINDTLLISYINGIFHPVAMEAAFHALLVEATTNITFSKKEGENLLATYDKLNKNGIIPLVCDALGDEYEALVEDLIKVLDKNESKAKTIVEQMTELVSSFTQAVDSLGDINEDELKVLKETLSKMGTPEVEVLKQ